VSGNSTLTATIKDSSGRALRSVDISGYIGQNSIRRPDSSSSRMNAQFRGSNISEITLRAGEQYYLDITSSNGLLIVPGAVDGSVSRGYSPLVTVDGYAQYRRGNVNWSEGWPHWHNTISKAYDVSFAFGTK